MRKVMLGMLAAAAIAGSAWMVWLERPPATISLADCRSRVGWEVLSWRNMVYDPGKRAWCAPKGTWGAYRSEPASTWIEIENPS